MLPEKERGPLHGLPFSVKEHIHLAGKTSTVGVVGRLNTRAEEDAALVAVIKSLGGIIFCRTNLPQTCWSYDCSNPVYGVTRNYEDPERSPGGSSGGEGALVAGGGTLMGIGSDSGGSVRIPAMFSGVTGLKPTAGRIPISGQADDGGVAGVIGICNTLGFLAKNASDIRVLMSVLLRKEVMDRVTTDPRFVPVVWDEQRRRDGEKLRIGWYDDDDILQATPGARRAVAVAIAKLESVGGHTVVPFRPLHLSRFSDLFDSFSAAGEDVFLDTLKDEAVDWQSVGFLHFPSSLPWLARWFLAKAIRPWSPILSKRWTTPASVPTLRQLESTRLRLTEELLADWRERQVDVVVAPGMAMPAMKLGYPGYLELAVNYTAVYNVLNFPVGSVKVSVETFADQKKMEESYPKGDLVYNWIKAGVRGAEGRSLNVQVVGRPWQEELVLRVMEELQE